MVTLVALSRCVLLCFTGISLLVDIDANRLELAERDTINASIVSALGVRGVQRSRAAQSAQTTSWAARDGDAQAAASQFRSPCDMVETHKYELRIASSRARERSVVRRGVACVRAHDSDEHSKIDNCDLCVQ